MKKDLSLVIEKVFNTLFVIMWVCMAILVCLVVASTLEMMNTL